jgi:nicotinate-nucleotide adenylyltransferase
VKIGVFGGTFDPPHVGHLMVAQDVVEALALDRLLFVPSAVPPHRDDAETAPARLRLEMTRAAVGGETRFRASAIEFEREGPSYTVDTLRELAREQPDAELHFLMGADQFARFDTWKEPAEVARLARLVVMEREGGAPASAPVADVPFDVVRVLRVDLSSTDIRARVREGRSIRHRVPDAVRRIIEDHGLYLS